MFDLQGITSAYIKRQASALFKVWGDRVEEAFIRRMETETGTRLQESDPIGLEWWLSGHEIRWMPVLWARECYWK